MLSEGERRGAFCDVAAWGYKGGCARKKPGEAQTQLRWRCVIRGIWCTKAMPHFGLNVLSIGPHVLFSFFATSPHSPAESSQVLAVA